MKRKKLPTSSSETHPRCRFCRDETYATKSLRIFPDEDCEWTHYCGECAEAMASVVRDAQGREPERRSLPDPPEKSEVPDPPAKEKPSKAEKTPVPEKESPPASPPPTPPSKTSPGGYDLLELMGWKK